LALFGTKWHALGVPSSLVSNAGNDFLWNPQRTAAKPDQIDQKDAQMIEPSLQRSGTLGFLSGIVVGAASA
jgi:hypothetical protein